jgi:hypothetical protein
MSSRPLGIGVNDLIRTVQKLKYLKAHWWRGIKKIVPYCVTSFMDDPFCESFSFVAIVSGTNYVVALCENFYNQFVPKNTFFRALSFDISWLKVFAIINLAKINFHSPTVFYFC